jgi:hypothetical protein
MHRIKLFLSLLILLFSFMPNSKAQNFDEVAKWTFESKNISTDKYELNFVLNLDDGWHIWSLDVGGDGMQIVPSFTFDNEFEQLLLDTINENGNITETNMEGIEGKVRYLSNKVLYTQTIKSKKGEVITGNLEYQICNDVMCLPPTSIPFQFEINQ